MHNGNRAHVQRAISCGFTAGHAHLARKNKCCETEVVSSHTHKYDVCCPPCGIITIDRVNTIAGVDDAVFLVGDVDRGLRMNRNYTMSIPSEAVAFVGNNFPVYLLVKDGNAHTLAFSTSYIYAFMRQNRHMFDKIGILGADLSLFPELAPMDMAVEGMEDEDKCKPKRDFEFRIIKNTTLADCSVTVEVRVLDECGRGQIDREIWNLLRVDCENHNTVMGGNLFPWDIGNRTCGDVIHIPVRTTDNGVLVIANFPDCGCGHKDHKRIHFNGCGCR